MIRVLVLPKISRTKGIAMARVALATAALILGYFYLLDLYPLICVLMGVFLVYSVVMLVRSRVPGGMFGLLALFGELIYFLVLASFGNEHLVWIASLFFLYLLANALVFHTAVQLGVVVGVCAAFCAVLPNRAMRPLEPTVVAAGAIGWAFAIFRQRQLSRSEGLIEKVKAAQREAEKARENERQRIASDFHDGPLQSFISLQMRLEILRKLLDRDFQAGIEDLKQLQALAQSQVRDLRAFLHSMRPVDLDGANLVATARRTAETFQKESGIPVTFQGTTVPVGLPQEMTSEVLQMLRESLHNVQKHAGATRVAVSMEKTDRGLEISVDDNGHGFSFAGTYTLEELELLRLGPASLKRRARSLNAELQLESRPGRGAGLKFRIPLQ